MKYILLLVFVALAWSACQKTTIGFLKTDNATYGLEDTLVIPQLKDIEQFRIDDAIPWVTRPIEGITGTKPIIYFIEAVKGPTPEAAATFKKELEIRGTGIMYCPLQPQVPAGKYVISLRVTNEGYSHIVNDIFTFIVK